MAFIQRGEDVADNSRLALRNGSVILSGNSPQGSVTRSSIESIGPTNASTILAGIFADYLESCTTDTSKESKDNSRMNRNITIEGKKIRNLTATSPVTRQRKTQAGTSEQWTSLSHGENTYVSNNFLTLSNVENNSGKGNVIEFREDETADVQNDFKIKDQKNSERINLMTNVGALIKVGNNSPRATGNTGSKFSHRSTVLNDFSNKTSHCTVQRNSRNRIVDRINNQDRMIKQPRSPRYVATYAVNLKRFAPKRRSSRSPRRESSPSCTSHRVYTVSELINKWSKLSAANRVQNNPRFCHPPSNKGFNIPKIVICSASGPSSPELHSAPITEEAVRKKKSNSDSTPETSLCKIRKTGLGKRNHKKIRSPVQSYIRGAGIGVFKHISVKSVQTPPVVKNLLPRNTKLKSPHSSPDVLNTAMLL